MLLEEEPSGSYSLYGDRKLSPKPTARPLKLGASKAWKRRRFKRSHSYSGAVISVWKSD